MILHLITQHVKEQNWTAIGMYNTPIFSLIMEEGEASRYRDLFRLAIEPALHDDLWRTPDVRDVHALWRGSFAIMLLGKPGSS